ncbi:FimD/PapC C-terminal domain-containing protein, partial [Pseudomonas citronellolis]
VPRRGAVVKARFAAASGRRVQLDLSLADGRKLPFGAQVSDAGGKLLAVVDNQSRALVFGLEDQGRLTVSWADGTCSAPYTLPRRDASLTYDQVKLVCGVQSSDGANP